MPEIAPTPPASNIPALTGIRLFAALGVLFTHFSEIDASRNLWLSWGTLNPLLLHGSVGVDVFFVLSGFILSHVYRERFRGTGLSVASWSSFLQNRFARVYPIHFVTMLGMLGIFFIGRHMGVLPHNQTAFTPAAILANLTLTHAWWPNTAAINGPAWSVSAEWFAYLLFPFLCAWLIRTRSVWPAFIVFADLVLSALTRAYPYPLFRIAYEFSFGVAVYELMARRRLVIAVWGQWVALALLLLSAYILSPLDSYPGVSQMEVGPLMRTGIVLACGFGFVSLLSGQGLLARFLSLRPIVYGGEISYSIYMCHWTVLTIVRRGLPHAFHGLTQWGVLILSFAVTIPVSMAAYHWIELPGRIALRRHLSKRLGKLAYANEGLSAAGAQERRGG